MGCFHTPMGYMRGSGFTLIGHENDPLWGYFYCYGGGFTGMGVVLLVWAYFYSYGPTFTLMGVLLLV